MGKRPGSLRDLIRMLQDPIRMERDDEALADLDRAIELDPAEDEFAAARTAIFQLTGRSDTDDAVPGNDGTEAT